MSSRTDFPSHLTDRLFISAKTADHPIRHIYTKTAVSNRSAASRWAIEHGVVRADVQGDATP